MFFWFTLIMVIFLAILYFYLKHISDDYCEKKEYREYQEECKRNRNIQYNRIKNDFLEIKEHKRFQRVMDDLSKTIEYYKDDIQYVEFPYSNTIYIRLTDLDKWAINPIQIIEFNVKYYGLKYDYEAFIYWILLKYSFLTYHVDKKGYIYETRDLKEAVSEFIPEYDKCDAATIIYRIEAEEKYWK